MNNPDLDKPATKADVQAAINSAIDRMEKFVLGREIDLFWKFLAIGLVLLGAQWAAITWMMAHWKP